MPRANYNEQEAVLIEEYGFLVRKKGQRFTVTDPKLPQGKNKYSGTDLYSVLCDAAEGRGTYEAVVETVLTVPPVPGWVEAFDDEPQSNVTDFPTPKMGPKPLRGRKMFEMKKLVYLDPEAKPEVILQRLRALGLDSSLSVVATVRSDFLNTLKVLGDVGALKRKDGEDAV